MQGDILMRATEYIQELEQVNRIIGSKYHELAKRARYLEATLQQSGVVHYR